MATELATREVSPMALIQDAIKEGMTPEHLAQLVDLQERMAKSAAEKEFARAMVECQKEMPTIIQDARNVHTNKKYATLEAIQREIKPIYSRFGFSMSFGEGDCPIEGYKRTTCDVTHEAGHTRHYYINLPIDASGSMNKVQGCVSTTSYGQRRLSAMIWNITIAGEDRDGHDGATVTEEQIASLKELVEVSGANITKFLEVYQIKALKDLPAHLYMTAVQQLKRKAEQRK